MNSAFFAPNAPLNPTEYEEHYGEDPSKRIQPPKIFVSASEDDLVSLTTEYKSAFGMEAYIKPFESTYPAGESSSSNHEELS